VPFTGSHPAAVVPLLRTALVPSALVIGSMIPDLPYYVPVPVSSTATHSAVGVVGIDLVLGVAVFAVWQLVLAPAVVGLAPAGLRDRLAPALPVHPRRHVRSVAAVALVVASLVVGAATHVLWDTFTHADRWGTDHVAWLGAMHGPIEGYRWMQHAGTVVGAAVLVVSAARWWVHTPRAPGAQRVPALGRREAGICVAIVGVCLAVGAATGLVSGVADGGLREGVFLAATWGGGAAAAAALLCALACRPRLRATARLDH
jgi:hypothetical protein